MDNPALSHFTRECDSGRRQNCYFCIRCGSRIAHIYVLDQGEPDCVSIKGGALNDFVWDFAGAVHLFAGSAVVPIPEGAEQHEGEPPSADKT